MEQHQGFTGRELYEIWRNHAIKQRMTHPPAWDDQTPTRALRGMRSQRRSCRATRRATP
jgi:hypothetical protein